MGLEFKPWRGWEEEEEEQGSYSSLEGSKQSASEGPEIDINLSGPADGGEPSQEAGEVLIRLRPLSTLARLDQTLSSINDEHRQYPVFTASLDDRDNEDGTIDYYAIVLDSRDCLGRGATKERALTHTSRIMHAHFGSMLLKGESIPPPSTAAELESKKAELQRDWSNAHLGNFSVEFLPLQFRPSQDYTAPLPGPESDGEYDSDDEEHEDDKLFDVDESDRPRL